MRAIPPALQTRLDGGCTTLATAWILRRTDGVVRGFTDHDGDLVVAGVPCRAASGFDATAAAEKLGFATGTAELAGALVDDAITAADLRAGRYDGARVEVHLVDWTEPALHVLLRVMTLGAVTREGGAFRAELRSRAAGLDIGDDLLGRDLAPAHQHRGMERAEIGEMPVKAAARDAHRLGERVGLQRREAVLRQRLQALPRPVVGGELFGHARALLFIHTLVY